MKLFFTLIFGFALTSFAKEVELKVSGMTCQMCASSVKQTLLQTDGVKDAKIYLKDGKALVDTDKEIDMTKLNEKLKAHGYSAKLK